MKKDNKQKKVITSDILVMLLIVGGILVALVGVVAYNFGYSAGGAQRVQQAEDAINDELIQMAENQQKMQEKYAGVYEVVTDGTAHESEDEYDLSVYKKDYPLINYCGMSGWQVIIRNNDGKTYLCVDTDVLNEYSDKLYTYITPYNQDQETANTISVLTSGDVPQILFCERIYFASQELKDAFVEVKSE